MGKVIYLKENAVEAINFNDVSYEEIATLLEDTQVTTAIFDGFHFTTENESGYFHFIGALSQNARLKTLQFDNCSFAQKIAQDIKQAIKYLPHVKSNIDDIILNQNIDSLTAELQFLNQTSMPLTDLSNDFNVLPLDENTEPSNKSPRKPVNWGPTTFARSNPSNNNTAPNHSGYQLWSGFEIKF